MSLSHPNHDQMQDLVAIRFAVVSELLAAGGEIPRGLSGSDLPLPPVPVLTEVSPEDVLGECYSVDIPIFVRYYDLIHSLLLVQDR